MRRATGNGQRPVRRSSRAARENGTLELPLQLTPAPGPSAQRPLADQLREFREFGTPTGEVLTRVWNGAYDLEVPTFVNEFWTAKQRAAHNLHEVSYRACFKPQLPRFFVERLTRPGEIVYDPFMGRGTTLLEAALLGRVPYGCDINPLSACLVGPRLNPPQLEEIAGRLHSIDLNDCDENPEDLLVFYHPDTLREICALKKYLCQRQDRGELDPVDAWLRMVALNRLTGHSAGFFSVYTLPPNQAVSVKSQRKINATRQQTPPRREVAKLILKKSRKLLADLTPETSGGLASLSSCALLLTGPSHTTPQIPDGSVALAVTSPPFLDVVDYATDNWLRCWFIGIEPSQVRLTILKKLADWENAMTQTLQEIGRVLRPGGHVAFEVGEVRGGSIQLEKSVLACGLNAGLEPLLVLINDQKFTKTANCWGVDNNSKGTNTNRVVVFRKATG